LNRSISFSVFSRALRLTFATGLLTLLGTTGVEAQQTEIPFHSTTKVRFASTEEAAALLGTADPWVRALSPFDRSVRMKVSDDPGQDAFVKFAAEQAQAWSTEQIDEVRAVVESAGRRIERLGLQLSLPPIVLLVRTSGKEEFHFAYTRQHAIILPENVLNSPADELEALFLHELFHIMSRHEPSIRRDLYGIIGYYACQDVLFPEELLPLRITNPDAFHYDFCIDVETDGTALTVTPVTYARGLYTEGDMLDWMVFRLVGVERSEGQWRPARDEDGLELFEPQEVSGFFEKIGRNTDYIIHPEETQAVNFAYAIVERDELPNPEILARILDVLGSRKTN
jgi:hypothetical protein